MRIVLGISVGECSKRIVVPSMNLETGEVHVYKTAHNKRFRNDYKEKIVDIAPATSAARFDNIHQCYIFGN
ncbi:hypothetical protein [Bacillus sp. AFS017336]|uniref:hypothetical protein n=1 Tax=Bacillus sp. AFS017336 TaxID=2033489 RepID=UPI000BF216D2|nr:hypothetical protein [Bacillus sp. AFS017336]PEL13847.1 hypothetical protein CN601_02785 [Bacillus sp. AFS017336]